MTSEQPPATVQCSEMNTPAWTSAQVNDEDRAPSRRGYPLPPWTREARYPRGAELGTWLRCLRADQAAAYLDALLDRLADAQQAASTCHVEDHAGLAAALGSARLSAELHRRELLDARLTIRAQEATRGTPPA